MNAKQKKTVKIAAIGAVVLGAVGFGGYYAWKNSTAFRSRMTALNGQGGTKEAKAFDSNEVYCDGLAHMRNREFMSEERQEGSSRCI